MADAPRRRSRRAAVPIDPDAPTTDNVTVTILGVSVLPAPAKLEFDMHVRAFGEDLLREAGRLEGEYRETDTPQFTDTMVRDAARTTRKLRIVTEKLSAGAIAMNAIGGLLVAAGGIFATFVSQPNPSNPNQPVISGVWLGLTIASYLVGALLILTSFFLPKRVSL